MERWRDMVGYEGRYQVSDFGNVRTLIARDAPRALATALSTRGYVKVTLSEVATGKRLNAEIHRHVALAFLGPAPTPNSQVNHLDGSKLNNQLSNLEWVSPSENCRHAIDILGKKTIPTWSRKPVVLQKSTSRQSVQSLQAAADILQVRYTTVRRAIDSRKTINGYRVFFAARQ